MTTSTQELERTPAERHGFLFAHNLSPFSPNLTDLHPLPSQIPFLLDVFSENVNIIFQIVHIPTIKGMVRDWRGREMKGLTPANEALMFAIYYAAITSMEEEDVSQILRCSTFSQIQTSGVQAHVLVYLDITQFRNHQSRA